MRRLAPVLILLLLSGCDYFIGQPAQPASISITPDTITVGENNSVAIAAVARDGNGNIMPNAVVEWTSSDFSIVAFDSYQGLLYAARPGRATIEARAGKAVATATVVVTRGVIKTLNVYPNRFVIVPGQQIQLFASPQDSQGHSLYGRALTFTATSGVATVTPQGLVTGISPGLATVAVESEGIAFDIQLRVSPPSLSYDYFKRAGTVTPGTATLTFAPQNVSRAMLAIDGKLIPVFTNVSYDLGVTCVVAENLPSPTPTTDALTKCAYDSLPTSIRVCTSNASDFSDPGRLMYVLLPTNDSGRVPSTASALLNAVQSTAIAQGIHVHSGCATALTVPGSNVVPQWIRNAPDTNFYLWPNTTTVHSAASVAAMLDGAAIFSAPGAGANYSRYLAIRANSSLFEVWH